MKAAIPGNAQTGMLISLTYVKIYAFRDGVKTAMFIRVDVFAAIF